MRDFKDNVVIICSIENFDPMGVHTGDSITVAPAQTLTDREYQIMCLMATGKRMKEIAVALSLSPTTISTYRSRILDKMEMSSTRRIIFLIKKPHISFIFFQPVMFRSPYPWINANIHPDRVSY